MSERTRIETDPLGEVRIPREALYGAQTQRAVGNFPVSGLRPWKAFIWSMATIKRAAAEINQELQLLDESLAGAIVQAAQEVIDGKWDDHFVVDPFQAGAGTSHNMTALKKASERERERYMWCVGKAHTPHIPPFPADGSFFQQTHNMNTNEVIANRATQILGGDLGEYIVHPNDHVNMAQSTNDAIPTAIRLGCLWRLDELLGVVEELSLALEKKAAEFDGVIKSGRTHLQDAVPVRLGQEFGAYAKAVKRDAERIRRASDGLRRLGIGGTVTGIGLNAHAEFHPRMVKRLTELTGIELRESEDLFESMQSMADMADFSASLRTLAITLTRIANDFRLLSSGPSSGLNEIRLPAVQPGSSIMPGKVNPVMAEMLNMALYHVIGCDTTVALAAQAGQLELNVMMPIIAHNLFEMMQVVIGAVGVFTKKCVRGLQANPEAAEGWLQRNAIIITALNPFIGYAAGAAPVKEALARGVSVRELALEKAEAGELRHRVEDRSVTLSEAHMKP